MSSRIEKAEVKGNEVVIQIAGHGPVNFGFFWLRDNCRCNECYVHETFQRKNDILDIPDDSKPKIVSFEKNNLKIEWDDGHKSEYASDFLFQCWSPNWRSRKVERYLWTGDEIKDKVAYVKRDDFLKTEDGFKRFLESLVKYGVAFVEEVDNNLEEMETIVKRVGPVMHTTFGGIWSFTNDLARADTAYTTVPLGPHNDNTYFEDAAGIQVFTCVEHTGTGGETLLVDGFYGAEKLKQENPKAFKILTEALQSGEYLDVGCNHFHAAPVITESLINKEIEQIRFNTYDRAPYCVGTGKYADEYYAALKALARKYTSREAQWHFKLHPGTVVFFDNWRVLHGRAEFTGKRLFGGAYMSRRDFMSAARTRNLVP